MRPRDPFVCYYNQLRDIESWSGWGRKGLLGHLAQPLHQQQHLGQSAQHHVQAALVQDSRCVLSSIKQRGKRMDHLSRPAGNRFLHASQDISSLLSSKDFLLFNLVSSRTQAHFCRTACKLSAPSPCWYLGLLHIRAGIRASLWWAVGHSRTRRRRNLAAFSLSKEGKFPAVE